MPRPIAILPCAYGFWLSAKKPKITLLPISRLFTRGNARFVYHLVGLAEGHATPHRDPGSAFDFLHLQIPRFLGIGVKALLFDSEHAECLQYTPLPRHL